MSRIAKTPILIPNDVEIKLKGQNIKIKGKNGELKHIIHNDINVKYVDKKLIFLVHKGKYNRWALAGTTRSLINNIIIGVTKGFTKKLKLVGVGYRATINNNVINLSLGYSHPINYILPTGIFAECPNQTEIILKSADKQMLGQTAADLRAYKKPEPYKGKGIRYADEIIKIKETKKK